VVLHCIPRRVALLLLRCLWARQTGSCSWRLIRQKRPRRRQPSKAKSTTTTTTTDTETHANPGREGRAAASTNTNTRTEARLRGKTRRRDGTAGAEEMRGRDADDAVEQHHR
jgi:hypothetical protein